MNFLLKIVEGPNKGAEIALVEGVAVTLGKGDACDIVLADTTLPDEALSIEASADGVSVGGEPVQPFQVKTFGATSFAVGPSDAPWGELKWPKRDESRDEGGEPKDEGTSPAPRTSRPASREESAAAPSEPAKRRRGCLGCFVVLILLLVLAGLAWIYYLRGAYWRWRETREGDAAPGDGARHSAGQPGVKSSATVAPPVSPLAAIAVKYGLSLSEAKSGTTLSGNLKTRRERLLATAEAYQAQPGVNLDISDDETFRASAEDALFTLTEGALKVAAATNRVVAITGSSPSPAALKKTLEALSADMPKLRNVDVSGVAVGSEFAVSETTDDVRGEDVAASGAVASHPSRRSRRAVRPQNKVDLPVCGILTAPYPCLVMRDGRRIHEGTTIAGSTIVKIGADYIVITNSTGRFEWKP